MISQKYHTIFIHIPKTGGTSIERKLELFSALERGVQDHHTIRDLEPVNWQYPIKTALLCFSSPRQFTKGIYRLFDKSIDQKSFDEFYKFTFVRNTWDRTYSIYYNIMHDEFHRNSLKIKRDLTFKEFILKFKKTRWLHSQLEWLLNEKGEIGVDFIGRFENLNEDFKSVCTAIQLKDSALPHLLYNPHPHYTEVYDPETINLVYKLYKTEILYFGFEFGK